MAGQEQARPVLGAQPPPPGTTPLRYASVKAKEQELELVPDYAYYYEDEQPLIDLSSENRSRAAKCMLSFSDPRE